MKRLIRDEAMGEVWEFDSADEVLSAMKQEVRTCGDVCRTDPNGNGFIYNHFMERGARWSGYVKPSAKSD